MARSEVRRAFRVVAGFVGGRAVVDGRRLLHQPHLAGCARTGGRSARGRSAIGVSRPHAAAVFFRCANARAQERENPGISDRNIQRRPEPACRSQRGDRHLSLARPHADRRRALRNRPHHRPYSQCRGGVAGCEDPRPVESLLGGQTAYRGRLVQGDGSGRLPARSRHGLRQSRAGRADQLR